MDNLLLSVTRFWYELRESKKRALAALIAVTHCWHTVMSLHPNPSDIFWLEQTTRTKVIFYKTKKIKRHWNTSQRICNYQRHAHVRPPFPARIGICFRWPPQPPRSWIWPAGRSPPPDCPQKCGRWSAGSSGSVRLDKTNAAWSSVRTRCASKSSSQQSTGQPGQTDRVQSKFISRIISFYPTNTSYYKFLNTAQSKLKIKRLC